LKATVILSQAKTLEHTVALILQKCSECLKVHPLIRLAANVHLKTYFDEARFKLCLLF